MSRPPKPFYFQSSSGRQRLSRAEIDVYLQEEMTEMHGSSAPYLGALLQSMDLSSFPVSAAQDSVYAPGLHLFVGASSTGKTTNALALYHHLSVFNGVPAAYASVMEPRGLIFDPSGQIPVTSATPENAPYVTVSSLEYTSWLHAKMVALRSKTTKEEQAGMLNPGQCPVLIMDSITYMLQHLSVTQKYLDKQHVATYKGGLSGADTIGALHHNAFAAACGVALIATLNLDLVPVARELKGACEGMIYSEGVGKIKISSRGAAGRKDNTFSQIRPESIQFGLTVLGYGTFDPRHSG